MGYIVTNKHALRQPNNRSNWQVFMPFDQARRAIMMTGAVAISVLASSAKTVASIAHEVQMLNNHPEDKKLRQIFSAHPCRRAGRYRKFRFRRQGSHQRRRKRHAS